MDFGSILNDLRSAATDFEKNRAEINVATAQFCQRACKLIDKVVKDAKSFDNLVICVWIVTGAINELIPYLADGALLTQLASKLFRQCARMVLDIQWQQLDEEDETRQKFQASLARCHDLLAPRDFAQFGLLQGLMDNAWTDPILTYVMGNEDDNEEGEGLAYIQAQDPEILRLRVELMLQENCDEFALNLCSWALKHPAIQHDLSLRKTQFILLHRFSNVDKIQEECEHIGVEDSVKLINSLQGSDEAKELCILLAQTFLVQNWIKPSSDDSKKELLHLWIQLQYQADSDQDRFISNLWAVAKVSHSTEQLLFIIDAVREQCGDAFIQFYTDLCVFALNVDKGCLEKLMKEGGASGGGEEAVARKRDMAKVCQKLSHIIAHVSPKISFCCALTQFALQPSEQTLKAMCDAYHRKTTAGSSSKSQCCSNCATDQGHCLKEADVDMEGRDVNIATLYEVERLCGMLRPGYLSSDNEFNNLFALCKQYLRKETGEAMKQGLPALMRNQIIRASPPAPCMAGSNIPPTQTRPNILRGATPAASQLQGAVSAQGGVGTSAAPSTAPAARGTLAAGAVPAAGQVAPGQVAQGVQSPQLQKQVVSQPVAGQSGTAAAPQAPDLGLVHQLVMKQLSAETVQKLLHLIQSGQMTPHQLSHLLMSGHFTSKQSQQTTPPATVQTSAHLQPQQQVQQQQLLKQQPPVQQQQLQVQQLTPQQLQVSQQIHQQLQFKLQPKTQAQVPQLQPKIGTPPVLDTTLQVQQAGVQQQSQASRALQAAAKATPLQPRIVSSHMVAQQAQRKPGTSSLQPASPQQQQQIVTAVQQVRPALQGQPRAALSTMRLPGTGGVSQRVQLMTIRQAAAGQISQAQVGSGPRFVLQGSHHMSGGSVIATCQPQTVTQQVIQLQPSMLKVSVNSVSSVTQPQVTAVSSQGTRLPGSVLKPSSASGAQNQPQTPATVSEGNRHYLINNLLFTGPEGQSSPLSIALPDTLPEISADSVSDTLRALTDSPTTDQVRVQNTGQQVPITTVRQQEQIPAVQNMQGVTPQGMAAMQQKLALLSQQVQQRASSQQVQQMPGVQQGQSGQPPTQALPSISTLFGQSKAELSGPVPITTNLTSVSNAAPLPAPLPQKSTNRGQRKGGAEKTGGKSSREPAAKKDMSVNKEALTQLLKQAMKLSMDQKQAAGTGGPGASYHTHIHEPSNPLVSAASQGSSQNIATSTAAQSQVPQPKTAKPPPKPRAPPKPKTKPPAGPVTGVSVSVHQPYSPAHQTQAQISQLHLTSANQSCATPVSLPPFLPSSPTVPSIHTVPSLASCLGNQIPNVSGRSTLSALTPTSGASQPSAAEEAQGGSSSTLHALLMEDKIPMPGALSQAHPFLSAFGGSSTAITGVSTPVPTTASSASAVSLLRTTTSVSFSSYSSSPVPAGASSAPAASTSLVTQQQSMSGSSVGVPLHAAKAPTSASTPASASGDDVPPVPSFSVPVLSTLPENAAVKEMKVGDGSDNSIATYRCIICATPFVTLDALRLHVKQVCRPGFAPPELGSRVAMNRAQATEAGLETSTVFQCMRCFELCISEDGIRQHKLVCSKAPKPKAKPKPRARTPKPKPQKTDDELATEARVLELLNKCLGEHRKEIEESKLVGTSGSAEGKPKKKPAKKRLSVSDSSSVGPPSEGSSLDGINSAKPQEVPKPEAAVDDAGLPSKVQEPVIAGQAAPLVLSGLEGDGEKPKPKRKYYPKKKKEPEGEGAGGPSGKSDVGEEVDKKKETAGKKPSKKKKEKESTQPPSPKFKELSGSGGRSFFKCLNCNQTLCSMENFLDHWAVCIVKKPLPPPKKRSVKKLSVSGVSDSNKQDTDSMATKCKSDDTERRKEEVPLSSEAETDGGQSNQTLPSAAGFEKPSLESTGSGKEAASETAAELGEECVQSVVEEAPVAFESVIGEVVNELEVVTEGSTSCIPHLKESVVVLEKVDLSQKLTDKSKKKKVKAATKGEGNKEPNKTVSKPSHEPSDLRRATLKSSDKPVSEHTQKVPMKKPIKRLRDHVLMRQKLRDRRKNRQGLPWFVNESVRAKMNTTRVKKENPAHLGLNKTCNMCGIKFSQRQVLIQHLAGKHVHPYTKRELGDTASYFCHLCQRVFPQYTQYMAHVVCHAQAIEKKMQDLKSTNFNSPGRSRRIAKQRGVPGQNTKKRGRMSPKGEVAKHARGQRQKDSKDVVSPTPETKPSPVKDRRSSGRAAQKQALSKIYISSLGIPNMVDEVKQSKKRRLGTAEEDLSVSKRTKQKAVAEAESSSSADEVDEKDKDSDWEPDSQTDDVADEDENKQSPIQEKPDKASMSVLVDRRESVTQSDSKTTVPPSSAASSVYSTVTSPPLSFPQTSKPMSSASKKPSFLDSFMSFISSRDVEEPLLPRPRRRFISAGNREEELQKTLAEMRRKSCEVQLPVLQPQQLSFATQPQAEQQTQPPEQPGSNAAQGSTDSFSHPASQPQARSSIPRARSPRSVIPLTPTARKDNSLQGVYYYGQYEEQLTKKCSVDLGTRVEDVGRQTQRETKHAQVISSENKCTDKTFPQKGGIVATAAAASVSPAAPAEDTPASASVPDDSHPGDEATSVDDGMVSVVEVQVDKDISFVLPSDEDISKLGLSPQHVSSPALDSDALEEKADAESGGAGSEWCVEGTLSVVSVGNIADVVHEQSQSIPGTVQTTVESQTDTSAPRVTEGSSETSAYTGATGPIEVKPDEEPAVKPGEEPAVKPDEEAGVTPAEEPAVKQGSEEVTDHLHPAVTADGDETEGSGKSPQAVEEQRVSLSADETIPDNSKAEQNLESYGENGSSEGCVNSMTDKETRPLSEDNAEAPSAVGPGEAAPSVESEDAGSIEGALPVEHPSSLSKETVAEHSCTHVELAQVDPLPCTEGAVLSQQANVSTVQAAELGDFFQTSQSVVDNSQLVLQTECSVTGSEGASECSQTPEASEREAETVCDKPNSESGSVPTRVEDGTQESAVLSDETSIIPVAQEDVNLQTRDTENAVGQLSHTTALEAGTDFANAHKASDAHEEVEKQTDEQKDTDVSLDTCTAAALPVPDIQEGNSDNLQQEVTSSEPVADQMLNVKMSENETSSTEPGQSRTKGSALPLHSGAPVTQSHDPLLTHGEQAQDTHQSSDRTVDETVSDDAVCSATLEGEHEIVVANTESYDYEAEKIADTCAVHTSVSASSFGNGNSLVSSSGSGRDDISMTSAEAPSGTVQANQSAAQTAAVCSVICTENSGSQETDVSVEAGEDATVKQSDDAQAVAFDNTVPKNVPPKDTLDGKNLTEQNSVYESQSQNFEENAEQVLTQELNLGIPVGDSEAPTSPVSHIQPEKDQGIASEIPSDSVMSSNQDQNLENEHLAFQNVSKEECQPSVQEQGNEEIPSALETQAVQESPLALETHISEESLPVAVEESHSAFETEISEESHTILETQSSQESESVLDRQPLGEESPSAVENQCQEKNLSDLEKQSCEESPSLMDFLRKTAFPMGEKTMESVDVSVRASGESAQEFPIEEDCMETSEDVVRIVDLPEDSFVPATTGACTDPEAETPGPSDRNSVDKNVSIQPNSEITSTQEEAAGTSSPHREAQDLKVSGEEAEEQSDDEDGGEPFEVETEQTEDVESDSQVQGSSTQQEPEEEQLDSLERRDSEVSGVNAITDNSEDQLQTVAELAVEEEMGSVEPVSLEDGGSEQAVGHQGLSQNSENSEFEEEVGEEMKSCSELDDSAEEKRIEKCVSPKATTDSDETDSEALPELCIVTEPVPVKTFSSTSSGTDGEATKPVGKMTLVPTHAPSTGSPIQETVVTAKCDNMEVQIVHLTTRKKAPVTHAAKTFIVSKTVDKSAEQKAAEEEEEDSAVVSPVRKPLLGVKPLRNLIKPKPFVWELDGGEDAALQARNERLHRAVKQLADQASFTWDVEEDEKAAVAEKDQASSISTGAAAVKEEAVSSDKDDQSGFSTCTEEKLGCEASDVSETDPRVPAGETDSLEQTLCIETVPVCETAKTILVTDSKTERVKSDLTSQATPPSVPVPSTPTTRSRKAASVSPEKQFRSSPLLDTSSEKGQGQSTVRNVTKKATDLKSHGETKVESHTPSVLSASPVPAENKTEPELEPSKTDTGVAKPNTRLGRWSERKRKSASQTAVNTDSSTERGDLSVRPKIKRQQSPDTRTGLSTRSGGNRKQLQSSIKDQRNHSKVEAGSSVTGRRARLQKNGSKEKWESPRSVGKPRVSDSRSKVQRGDSKEGQREEQGSAELLKESGSARLSRHSSKEASEESQHVGRSAETRGESRGKMLRSGSQESTDSEVSGRTSRSQRSRSSPLSIDTESTMRSLRSKESSPELDSPWSVHSLHSKESTPDLDLEGRAKTIVDRPIESLKTLRGRDVSSDSDSQSKVRSARSRNPTPRSCSTQKQEHSVTKQRTSRSQESAASLDLQKSVKIMRKSEASPDARVASPVQNSPTVEHQTRSKMLRNAHVEKAGASAGSSPAEAPAFSTGVQGARGRAQRNKDTTHNNSQSTTQQRADKLSSTTTGDGKRTRSNMVQTPNRSRARSLSPLKKADSPLSTVLKGEKKSDTSTPVSVKRERTDASPVSLKREKIEVDSIVVVSQRQERSRESGQQQLAQQTDSRVRRSSGKDTGTQQQLPQQTEARTKRPSAPMKDSSLLQSQQDPPRRSQPKPEGPAMVRRRQGSSPLVTNLLRKKPRLHTAQSPQLEVIRVAPVMSTSSDQHRRTRSHDPSHSPRTVHTRMSAEEYEASQQKTGKAGSDQKWLIDRQIASVARRGVHRTQFPFAFSRPRSKKN